MTNLPQDLVNQITAIQWIAVVVVGVLAINGLATLLESLRKIHQFGRDVLAHLTGRRTSDQELKKQALEVARNLMDLVQTRQRSEPAFSFDRFHESSEALSRHSQETQNLYVKEFAGKIAFLRQELLKRNLQDKELDSFYEHPT
jgi:hypothetical protein